MSQWFHSKATAIAAIATQYKQGRIRHGFVDIARLGKPGDLMMAAHLLVLPMMGVGKMGGLTQPNTILCPEVGINWLIAFVAVNSALLVMNYIKVL